MLRITPAITFALPLFTFCHAQFAGAPGSLVRVLEEEGLTIFAGVLTNNAPNVLANLTTGRNDLVIFAADAPLPEGYNVNISRLVRKEPPEVEALLAACATYTWDDSGDDDENDDDDGDDDDDIQFRLRKRQSSPTPLPDSNFELRNTFLTDANFINLGPGENLKWVSNYADPNGTGENAVLELTTGNGNVVQAVRGPVKFDNGIIYVTDSWPTLPTLLSATLESNGLTQFASALEESDILDNVETIPGITVFAYRNGDGDFNISAAGLVLNDTVEYTPTLDSGRAYTTVAGSTITPVERSGAWFVNGRRIVKANIPIMNGVLHILENVEEPPVQIGSAPSLNSAGWKGSFLAVAIAAWVLL